tara:strand:- start:786 stop:1283 length:498 start_codon:yes stop_codon:yes gene_type:complete
MDGRNIAYRMVITLTSAEQTVAKSLAVMREQIARAIGRVDQQIGKQAGWETDEQGIGGEFAAARAYNVFPCLELKPDAGFDLMVKGKKIDVKTTKYRTGRLLAKLNQRDDEVDIFLLVTGEFPTFKIVGYATAKDLLKKENVIDLGHGPGYALTQDQLTPPFKCA